MGFPNVHSDLATEYFFYVETIGFERTVLSPYFGGMTLSEQSNVYVLSGISYSQNSYLGTFQQGYWNLDEGTYEQVGTDATRVINLTGTFILPFKTLQEWNIYAKARNGKVNSMFNFTGTSTATIASYYSETMNVVSGDVITFEYDLNLGILRNFLFTAKNGSYFKFWSVDRSQFGEYTKNVDTPKENNMLYIVLATTMVGTTTYFLWKRKR